MFDFQFYDKKRIDELVALENEAVARRRELAAAVRVSIFAHLDFFRVHIVALSDAFTPLFVF